MGTTYVVVFVHMNGCRYEMHMYMIFFMGVAVPIPLTACICVHTSVCVCLYTKKVHLRASLSLRVFGRIAFYHACNLGQSLPGRCLKEKSGASGPWNGGGIQQVPPSFTC